MKAYVGSSDLLETIVAETEKVNNQARKVVEGLTETQLNWRPSPEQWSIAQCLDHLTVTGKAWAPILTTAIARGHQKWPISTPTPYRPTMIGGWLIKQVTPEAARKLPAPRVFKPSESSSIDKSFDNFLLAQKTFLDFVNSARGCDYNKSRLRSPVTPLIRYSLADAFVVSVVHSQRHLAQARRVRENPNFPDSSL